MKRSEMVRILDQMLNAGLPEEYQFNADTFLCNLEAVYGMQPPTIRIMEDCYNRTEGQMGFDVNEWEDETNSD
jgi:hypothetical protein